MKKLFLLLQSFWRAAAERVLRCLVRFSLSLSLSLAVGAFLCFSATASAQNFSKTPFFYFSLKPGVCLFPDLEMEDYHHPVEVNGLKRNGSDFQFISQLDRTATYDIGEEYTEFRTASLRNVAIRTGENAALPSLTFSLGTWYSDNIRIGLEFAYKRMHFKDIKGVFGLDGKTYSPRKNNSAADEASIAGDPWAWPPDPGWKKYTTRRRSAFSEKLQCSLSVYSLLTNLIYDFRNSTIFTPYLSAGLGVAYSAFCSDSDNAIKVKDANNYGLACQIGAGVGIALNEQLILDCGYSYFDTTLRIDINGRYDRFVAPLFSSKLEFTGTHNLTAGIRYVF